MYLKRWKYKGTAFDGAFSLFSVNIFDYKWENTKQTVTVQDPIYHIDRNADIYSVTIKEKTYKFATVEVSNCVWNFYV